VTDDDGKPTKPNGVLDARGLGSVKLDVFSREVTLPVAAEEAFAWHERPGALRRLIPPWENVHVVDHGDGIRNGSRVVLRCRLGPLRLRWVAEHCDYRPGRLFRDVQVHGPLAHWDHAHRFIAKDTETSVLEDRIEYRIRGRVLGRLIAGRFVRKRLRRMFAYRHRTTADDLAAHRKFKQHGTLHVAVTGSHGLIGRELVPFLTTGGHRVTGLVRGEAGPGQVAWNPRADSFDASALDGIHAVVHLAGENIAAARWSEAQKQRVRQSRVHATRVLCEGLARMSSPPKVLVAASAVGFYGDRGDELLDEDSPAGSGFLADVSREWEAATQPAAAAGIRVVVLRFGVVLSPRGGALARMLTPFRLGGGGPIGSGRQFWSWIALNDAAGAIHHALMTDDVRGPVNAVAPAAASNRDFTKTLGRVLSRPTLVPMPAFAARLALGEMADELLLASTRVRPKGLLDSGYAFRHTSLEDALRHVLGRSRRMRIDAP